MITKASMKHNCQCLRMSVTPDRRTSPQQLCHARTPSARDLCGPPQITAHYADLWRAAVRPLWAVSHEPDSSTGFRKLLADVYDQISSTWSEEFKVFVCNAGVIMPEDVVDSSPDLLDVMLRSPIHFIRVALRQCLEHNNG